MAQLPQKKPVDPAKTEDGVTENNVPKDAEDIDALMLDNDTGDDITAITYHRTEMGKPKNFFRTVPDKDYRKHFEIYIHKPEGVIDEQTFIIGKSMRGIIDEARPCLLVTVVYRDGTPRLWPLKSPKEGERDNKAWESARSCAKAGVGGWVKLVWNRGQYFTRNAEEGYAPEPDWTKPPFKLPPFNDLVRAAIGTNGVIRDKSHPIYRELYGAGKASEPTEQQIDDADDL
jgi:hypothetical protein